PPLPVALRATSLRLFRSWRMRRRAARATASGRPPGDLAQAVPLLAPAAPGRSGHRFRSPSGRPRSGGAAAPALVDAGEADDRRVVEGELLELRGQVVDLVQVRDVVGLELGTEVRHRERGQTLALALPERRLHDVDADALEPVGVETARQLRTDLRVASSPAQRRGVQLGEPVERRRARVAELA